MRTDLTEVEVFQGVINLLQDPDHWIKRIRSTNADGLYVVPISEQAAKWCLGGAVMRVLEDNEDDWMGWWQDVDDPIGSRLHHLAKERGYTSNAFVEFNNDPRTTHEDLMALLKEALSEAEMEESYAKA